MAGLALKHVYKIYPGRQNSGEFVAVKDLNIEIEDGEFIVIVGPSGCGKSTTIRMVAGLEDLSAGELYIDGVLVNDVAPDDRDVAMVFQSYALFPHMTARQNIEFALKLRKIPYEKRNKNGEPVLGIDKNKIKEIKAKIKTVEHDLETAEDKSAETALSERKRSLENDLKRYSETPVRLCSYRRLTKQEIAERVQWAARTLGIEELLDNMPAEMSGGQQQRVALGRAMVRDPKVFLLDEPLSDLDAKLRTDMRYEIVKLHNELKTTFIYVTHDQVEAMTMGTRIVVMDKGIVQQIDTPTDLFDYPVNKFVAGFIGTPQMNFFDVTVKKNGDILETTFVNGRTVELELSKLRRIEEKYLDGKPHEVTLGMRGEHIRTVDSSSAPDLAKNSIDTKLVVKEILGSSTRLFVRLTDDGPNTVIIVPDRNGYAEGDTVRICFDERYVHLFDRDTESSIMKRETGNA